MKKGIYGITLISLTITIVVILILSAVTISIVIGNNSIMQTAKQTKEELVLAQEEEKLKIEAGRKL